METSILEIIEKTAGEHFDTLLEIFMFVLVCVLFFWAWTWIDSSRKPPK